MELLLSTLAQMFFLFAFLFLGFLLTKLRFLPDNSAAVLSRLENAIFIPALVLGTFLKNCTRETLGEAGRILLFSLALELLIIPLAILLARLCSRSAYLRKIYTYGLAFANFGFMGNAVVEALFPDLFYEYLVFTLPLWFFIYAWAVPSLLLPRAEGEGKRFSLGRTLRSFVNPMFICMAIGAVIGLSGLIIPKFILNVVDTAGSCMSPVAMLLTGITVAKIDLRAVLRRPGIYVATALRLVALPLLFLLVLWLLPLPDPFVICAVCALAMPLGLNTVVVPAAYGLDTSDAAGMALVSHVCSILTIPLIFALMQAVL